MERLQPTPVGHELMREVKCICHAATELCRERKGYGKNQQSIDRDATRNALPLLNDALLDSSTP